LTSGETQKSKYFKVIACEIALRELCHTAATARNIIDFDFLTQGHHDTPALGRVDIQSRIDAVPESKYDAIILGYGLCSNILSGLKTAHTPLVVPRAHDCITLFLGSKERYQQFFETNPGTYYYTAGWLECARRRNLSNPFLPASSQTGSSSIFQQWISKYGEEKAKYLMDVMGEWAANYNRGTLIDYSFTNNLHLDQQVKEICGERGWEYTETKGDLALFERLLDGNWSRDEVLIVEPGYRIVPVHDARIIGVEKM
jgi:hypothetical protein